MPIDYQRAIAYQDFGQRFKYSDREVMLYALAVGFGRDPLDARELPFVYEQNLQALPSFASVMASGCFKVRELGINFQKILHGEYFVQLAKPLPPQAEIQVDVSVPGIWDKGADKGAVVIMQADVRDATDGSQLCSIRTGYFCRGDGGFLKAGEVEKGAAPKPHVIPQRLPDAVLELPTRVDQALLYRLCGDRNPLHADPEEARKVGFERPILHGLCTYGITCAGIVRTFCEYDAGRIESLGVRFSRPVFPGETIVLDMWKDGTDISFRARVKERDLVVIDNGHCKLWY